MCKSLKKTLYKEDIQIVNEHNEHNEKILFLGLENYKVDPQCVNTNFTHYNGWNGKTLKCWQKYENSGNLTCCLSRHALLKLNIWMSVNQPLHSQLYTPKKCLHVHQGVYVNVHISIIHYIFERETTQMSINNGTHI